MLSERQIFCLILFAAGIFLVSSIDIEPNYLDILKNGLVHCNNTLEGCKFVVVVGCGASGLVTGILLKQAGHTVVIYEANSRCGGRIETYCHHPTGACVDLGAMRYPDSHPLVTYMIKDRYKKNLTCSPFFLTSPSAPISINGDLTTWFEGINSKSSFGYLLKESERGKTAEELWDEAVKEVLDLMQTDPLKAIQKYDIYNIYTYLWEKNYSYNATRFMSIFLNFVGTGYTSLLEALQDQINLGSNNALYQISGGSQKLVDALVAEMGSSNIFLNSTVTGLVIPDQRQNEVWVKLANGSQIFADAVVLTPTANKVLTMDIPQLDNYVRSALNEIHYDSSTKVVLFFSYRFWEIDYGICGGHSVTDRISRFIWYLSGDTENACGRTKHPSGGGAIIGSYTWGDDSLLFAGLSEQECLNITLKELTFLFKEDIVYKYYIDGKAKKWDQDQFSLGAFALFSPLQRTVIEESLSKPNKNIYFAGEHTSPYHAWVEGAIYSGVKASLQLISSVTYDYIIIGGGPIGLATAWQLKKLRPTSSVVVVEKEKLGNTSSGSSAGSTRQFREMYSESYLAKLAMNTLLLYRDLEKEAGLQEGDLVNTDNGYLFFGDPSTTKTTEGDLPSIQKTCNDLSQQCENLNASNISDRFPFKNLSSATKGLWNPNSGYISVTRLMNALIKVCSQQGVYLRDMEDVLTINQPTGKDPFKILTSRGQILADKIILAPGAYANEVFKNFGFQINLSIWEMTSVFFPINDNQTTPTWFYFGSSESDLYYGFPEDPDEMPGYQRVSPDFVSNPISSPKNRTNKPDMKIAKKTATMVQQYMSALNFTNYIVGSQTCLASMVPDGGFIVDYAPALVPNNKRIVLQAAGWAMKFVPSFGLLLAQLAMESTNTPDEFSINLPGRLVVPPNPPNDESILTATIISCVVGGIIIFLVIYYVYKKICHRKEDKQKKSLLEN